MIHTRKQNLINAVLSYHVTDSDLQEILSEYGFVEGKKWTWDIKQLNTLMEEDLDEMLEVLIKRYKTEE